jgi:hypothetical protein
MKLNLKIAASLLALTFVAAVGWQWYRVHFPSWDEEVQLTDGRVITIHRAHTFNTDHQLINTRLTIDLPELGGKKVWEENLYPAIVEIDQSKVYVVGSVRGSTSKFGQYLAPRYLYVAFIYDQGAWLRIPFMTIPEKFRKKENILSCLDQPTHVSLSEKQSGWCTEDGSWRKTASSEISLAKNEQYANQMLRWLDGTGKITFKWN